MSSVELTQVRISVDPDTFQQRLLVDFTVILNTRDHEEGDDKLKEEDIVNAFRLYFNRWKEYDNSCEEWSYFKKGVQSGES